MRNVKNYVLLMVLFSANILLFAQKTINVNGARLSMVQGNYVDERDKNEYKTITFSQVGTSDTAKYTWLAENLRYEMEGSIFFKGMEDFAETYGRLYTYKSAVNACPKGYHLPDLNEWEQLFKLFGGVDKSGSYLVKNGTSNMDLLLGGIVLSDGKNYGFKIQGNWWYNVSANSPLGGAVTIEEDNAVYLSKLLVNNYLSCRCVKD